jgi:hypothetical protein
VLELAKSVMDPKLFLSKHSVAIINGLVTFSYCLAFKRTLINVLGVTPLIARRIANDRPFRDVSALLHCKGVSADMLIAWESKGIRISFSDEKGVMHEKKTQEYIHVSACMCML